MRTKKLLLATLAGVTLAACVDLEVTDPNRQSSASFWRTSADANRGLTATYNSLLLLGTYARWQVFAHDMRSDIGTARTSPWGDLANYGAFQLNDYNFEINRHLWIHNYELIGRANQVIARVPAIEMNTAERDRIVAEAKFLRALAYYNLVTLFENVPLITAPPSPNERPAAATPSATFAQIEQDLVDAAAVLPETYGTDANGRGRPTKWAALTMLGKVRLQMAGVLDMQPKWGEAATALSQVIGKFMLLTNYADNFKIARDFSNSESIFEVSNEDMWPVGVTGLSFPKMAGPCYRPGPPIGDYNPTFCDLRPTRWYFDQFRASTTTTGTVDPRLDATILYSPTLYGTPAQNTEMIYGRTRASYFVDNAASAQREDTMLFFRKYGETELNTEQRWDNPINYKVLRYADVLLMHAEALNESGGTGAAGFLNMVRQRAGKAPVGTLTQAAMRDTILMERMFEFGLEASRFNDLRRHDRLDPTVLRTRDLDFERFEVGKSERLPIPTTERNRNPNLAQNPGW